MEVILIGFILGVTGLILKCIGVALRKEQVSVVFNDPDFEVDEDGFGFYKTKKDD